MVFSTSFNIIYFIQLSLYLLLCFSCITSTPSLAPLVTTSLFSVSLLLVCYIQSCDLFFRLHNTGHHTVFIFFHLTCFIQPNALDSVHIAANGKSSMFYGWVVFHCVFVWIQAQCVCLGIHTETPIHTYRGFFGLPRRHQWQRTHLQMQEMGNSSVPESGRPPGEGNGNPFQCSCLENPRNRGAWWAAVHGVTRVGHAQGLNHHHHGGFIFIF